MLRPLPFQLTKHDSIYIAVHCLNSFNYAGWHENGNGSRESSNQKLSNHFVGDASCVKCHAEQAKYYEKTAHRLTLQLPSSASILGSFSPRSNTLRTLDPAVSLLGDGLTFEMTRIGISFYQTEIRSEIDDVHGNVKISKHTERVGLVTGSGVRGQSYLYWRGDELYELPISYWAEGHQWINSPGYPDGSAIFDRAVYPRCLECHTTFIQPLSESNQTNRYIVSSLIVGITCEKCHGPGQRHVDFESTNETRLTHRQDDSQPSKLSRDRQIDLCALCHNGVGRESTRPAFTFMPGESLDDFFAPDPAESSAEPDVHGNQVALLKRSQCFRSSPTMTCSTCHDEHAPERPADDYSDHCLACHQVSSCGLFKTEGESIRNGCVSCHMPIQKTNAIISQTSGRVVRASMRTHWIRVYR